MYRIILVILVVSPLGWASADLLSSGKCSVSQANNGWKTYTAGVDPTLLDTHVTYWRYTVEIPQDYRFGIRVTGKFPYGTYTSFNVYDQDAKNRGDSLPDVSIVPDKGSINPYLPKSDFFASNRNYTVHVVPTEFKKDFVNSIALPQRKAPTEKKAIELWYRIYEPLRDQNGGVLIPEIEVFDPATGKPIACPPVVEKVYENKFARDNLVPLSSAKGDILKFFPASGNAMYPNGHTAYVAGIAYFRLPVFKPGPVDKRVAVIRFQPPKVANTEAADFKGFSGEEEVRYYSFCISGISTVTKQCLSSKDLKKDADGKITVVLGPGEFSQTQAAKRMNYLNKEDLPTVFIVYRNLMSSDTFAGRFSDPVRTPPWSTELLDKAPTLEDAEALMENQQAHRILEKFGASEYAPQGYFTTWAELVDQGPQDFMAEK